MGLKLVKSNFFIFLEPRKKSEKKFSQKKSAFFRKINDFSLIFLLLIFPSSFPTQLKTDFSAQTKEMRLVMADQ